VIAGCLFWTRLRDKNLRGTPCCGEGNLPYTEFYFPEFYQTLTVKMRKIYILVFPVEVEEKLITFKIYQSTLFYAQEELFYYNLNE
jgi:hypothetical protein